MKTLYTQRLILRAFTIEDANAMYNNYGKSPVVGPMAGWKPHESIEETKKLIDIFIKEDEIWAVCLKSDNIPIGSVGLHNDVTLKDTTKKVKMLGYVLSEQYWGQGIIPEACREVLKFAFSELKLDVVTCCHFKNNMQSKRVIEKLGFRYYNTFEKAYQIYDGTYVDDVCYTITEKDQVIRRG